LLQLHQLIGVIRVGGHVVTLIRRRVRCCILLNFFVFHGLELALHGDLGRTLLSNLMIHRMVSRPRFVLDDTIRQSAAFGCCCRKSLRVTLLFFFMIVLDLIKHEVELVHGLQRLFSMAQVRCGPYLSFQCWITSLRGVPNNRPSGQEASVLRHIAPLVSFLLSKSKARFVCFV